MRRTVLVAAEVCGFPVTVVTGAEADRVADCLTGLDVVLAYNVRWRDGLAGSLACGLRSLGPGCDAALVTPCDLPGLQASDLARLAAAWVRDPERPAAASYDGVVGVPAVLPARVFGQLVAISGDSGARHLLRGGTVPVTTVECPSAAADLDDRRALEALRRAAGADDEDPGKAPGSPRYQARSRTRSAPS